MIKLLLDNSDIIFLGTIGSILATVVVLLSRHASYKIRDHFPARSLFKGVVGSDAQLLIFIVRLTDENKSGKFLTPFPQYAVASDQPRYEKRQLTPWVTSISETQSVANVLNVLGRVGRTEKIQISYVDQDFDRWDAPMFILGGSFKATRSFETCVPIFSFRNEKIILEPTGEMFAPKTADNDIGFLQKTINPSTGLPVWVAMGWRGAGTVSATWALSKWWKEIGILYGSKSFGILLGMNDKDGWQQSQIVKIYPEPKIYKKILHPLAWKLISNAKSDKSIRTEQGA